MYANYGAYTPWDVSTYFMGPRSLIDPRYIGTDRNGNTFATPGAQVGPIDPYISDRPTLNIYANQADLTQTISRAAASVDATNNGVYPAPLFSHNQIIIAKTEFVQDPEIGVSNADKTGVKTIPVGEIYALDWQTGAPVWRFPDRTYLPLGATLNNVAITSAGGRNPEIGYDPIQKEPVFAVPGIVAIDRNGDGVISDDEVFLGTSQTGVFSNLRRLHRNGGTERVRRRGQCQRHDRAARPGAGQGRDSRSRFDVDADQHADGRHVLADRHHADSRRRDTRSLLCAWHQ